MPVSLLQFSGGRRETAVVVMLVHCFEIPAKQGWSAGRNESGAVLLLASLGHLVPLCCSPNIEGPSMNGGDEWWAK